MWLNVVNVFAKSAQCVKFMLHCLTLRMVVWFSRENLHSMEWLIVNSKQTITAKYIKYAELFSLRKANNPAGVDAICVLCTWTVAALLGPLTRCI